MMKNIILEMSTCYVGIKNISGRKKNKDSDGNYYIALNGDKDYVRPIHFHIYDKRDKKTYNKNVWTIEFNFQRYLCTGDLYIRRIVNYDGDVEVGPEHQDDYMSIKENIENLLFERPNVKQPSYVVDAKDNIAALIAIFNEEADIIRNGKKEYANVPKREKFLTIMKENSGKMKILPQFRRYFPEDLQKKYSMCFQ